MKRIALNVILIPLLALLPAATFAAPAYAACGNSSAAQQVSGGVGETTSQPCNDSGVMNAVKLAVQILSIAVGVTAVVAIIWSGFKYITSGGDAGKVANAKNTLIYALVGIAIAVLAQVFVNIVLTQSKKF